jgi:hypothetical protein
MIPSIKKLQSLGVPQSKFMFKISILFIPSVSFVQSSSEVASKLTYLARSTTIPSKEHEVVVMKIAGGTEYTVPVYQNTDHNWNATFFLLEKDPSFNALVTWFNNADTLPLELLKSYAWIDLLNLNEEINRRIYLLGLYPKKTPDFGEINQTDTEGFVELDCSFAFDDISYNNPIPSSMPDFTSGGSNL